jgi:hypothetical protein
MRKTRTAIEGPGRSVRFFCKLTFETNSASFFPRFCGCSHLVDERNLISGAIATRHLKAASGYLFVLRLLMVVAETYNANCFSITEAGQHHFFEASQRPLLLVRLLRLQLFFGTPPFCLRSVWCMVMQCLWLRMQWRGGA